MGIIIPWIRQILSALLSGVLLVLSFPNIDYEWLVWVSFVPLLLALSGRHPISAFFLGWLTGLTFFVGLCSWVLEVKEVQGIDVLLMTGYLGIYVGLFCLGFVVLSNLKAAALVIFLPALWVAFEYVRAHFFFLELPWGLLGYSQSDSLLLIQFASFTGVYGISFLIMMVNVAIFQVLTNCPRSFTPLVLAVALIGSLSGYGWLHMNESFGGEPLKVTVVQGNVDRDVRLDSENQKAILANYVTLTKRAHEVSSSSLVIWPETAVPGSLLQNASVMDGLSSLVQEIHTPLLFGNASRPKGGTTTLPKTHRFNRVYLLSQKGGLAGQYDKIKLIPFGEYLPHDGSIPWPTRYRSPAGYFQAGTDYSVFHLEKTKFSVLICWESLFPGLVRQSVLRGSQVLVNMTNEAPGGDSAAPHQFLSMNIFRAVENQRFLVRSANSGISSFIDPYGRVVDRVREGGKDTFVTGFLTQEVRALSTMTFYSRFGDVFAYSSMAIALLGMGWGLMRKRKSYT